MKDIVFTVSLICSKILKIIVESAFVVTAGLKFFDLISWSWLDVFMILIVGIPLTILCALPHVYLLYKQKKEMNELMNNIIKK